MSPMVRRSLTIEHALLGFLQQGPLHGYQLHQKLCDPAGLKQVWYLKQAQLYALLGKLEEAGYITATIQPQETRPARRVFRLTPAGQDAFQDWLFSPVLRPRQMRQEFQAKIYFAQYSGGEACARLIAVQCQACQHWLAAQKTYAERESAANDYAWLVDQYRVGQIQAMLDWLKICQEKLQEKTK
jgi:PadR family transcriptional regulator, regulatory protein AphA